MNLLAEMNGWQILVCFLFVVICILLILVILLQKGRGGGLAGAFGGVGGHSAFGAKTGDIFTVITICLTLAFIVMAVIGTYVFVPRPSKDIVGPGLTTPAPQGTGETGTTGGETGENTGG
jgi:preprotein translocase subunit SecG